MTDPITLDMEPDMTAVALRSVPGFSRYGVTADGDVVSNVRRKPRLLRPIRRGKYPGFTLLNDVGLLVAVYQHRFVCEAFHGPCPVGQECRHLDGKKDNPHPSNLAWGSRVENHADKHRHGTSMQGIRHHAAKLDDGTVQTIRVRHQGGASLDALAEEFGVSRMTVFRAATGQSWSHI